MSYIAYLDMLGTQGFCGDPEEYYTKITNFSKAISQCVNCLENKGKIGFFSDSAYIECCELKPILTFLLALRSRMCSEGLFFNCAITKGQLGISDPHGSDNNLFGVLFSNSQIAKVYVVQNQFKGIGIFLSDDIVEEIEQHKLPFTVVKSFYLPDIDKPPVMYNDLSIDLNYKYYTYYADNTLRSIISAQMAALSNSKKHGRYYVSLLGTIINSVSCENLKWDRTKHKFITAPTIFNLIFGLASDSDGFPEILGLDSLCIMVVNRAYRSENITDFERSDIAMTVMNLELFKNKYKNNMENLPKVFDDEAYREQFISYYMENIRNEAVDRIINKSTYCE